jgi:hypothetical protein
MDDIQLETIKLRLEGIRQSIARSRTTFLISTIMSVAIFVTAWNAYLSWDSGFVMQPYWSEDTLFTEDERINRLKDLQEKARIDINKLKEAGVDTALLENKIDPNNLTGVTDYAQQQLVAEWVKNQIITVSLLGIRVSVSDLPVIGSLSLVIISIWFFYSVRRENRAIGTLLRDAYRLKDWHVRYMVYQGIVHNLVLIELGRGTKPIYDFKKEESDDIKHLPIVTGALKVLFYLPPLSILFVVIMDVLTLFYFAAPFRPSHKSLAGIIPPGVWIKVIAMESIAIALLLLTAFLCQKIRGFINATEALLKNYRLELKRSVGERRIND